MVLSTPAATPRVLPPSMEGERVVGWKLAGGEAGEGGPHPIKFCLETECWLGTENVGWEVSQKEWIKKSHQKSTDKT
jgi:hypothetical protein